MAGFAIVGIRFEVYGAALQSMLNSPAGPVGLALLEEANTVNVIAQTHCPVEEAEAFARHPSHLPPGSLRDSIQVTRPEDLELSGLVFLIGSTLAYARRIEFNPRVGGFLRGAVAAVGGPHSLNAQAARLGSGL